MNDVVKLIDSGAVSSESVNREFSPKLASPFKEGQEMYVHLQISIEDNGVGISEEG